MTAPITEQELTEARKIWGDALVAISTAYDEEGIEPATALANGALDAAYAYNMGDVLFKPTLASGEQTFRPTREGALSYFVGHNVKTAISPKSIRAGATRKTPKVLYALCCTTLHCLISRNYD